MCSLCWLPVAKKQFWAILIFGELLYGPPFTDQGQIWCARADPRSTLTCQISSQCIHCVGFRWPKNNFGQFVIFGDSCIDLLLPMTVIFGVLEQTQCLHLQAKFYLNVLIVSASSGPKPQFWANFDTFVGSCIDALLLMRAKFGVL